MAIVDAVDAPSVIPRALAGMADDVGPAEPGLDAVVGDVDPQALADQPRGRAVEDAVNEEAAGPGDAGEHLGDVGGAAGRQGPQGRRFDPHGVVPAPVTGGDELVDEAAPVGDVVEVARGTAPGRARS